MAMILESPTLIKINRDMKEKYFVNVVVDFDVLLMACDGFNVCLSDGKVIRMFYLTNENKLELTFELV